MKRIKSKTRLLSAWAMYLMIFFFSAGHLHSQTVVDRYGRLQVHGAHVCAEDFSQISLGGMSFFWSNWDAGYYNRESVDYLVNEFQVSIVRAAAGVAYTPEEAGYTSVAASGGVLDNNFDGSVQQVENVVDAAIANGIYVIIDWHVEGKADKYGWWVDEGKRFFRHFASKYGTYPNIIYEVYNEPAYDGNNTSTIEWFCQEMVNTIRGTDPDNLIICGSKDWSQQPNSYWIEDSNVAYSFHAYPDASYGGSHMDAFYANVPAAMESGKAVFVTEFGAQYGQHTRTDELINKCQEWKISMCAWSVNNKSEPWSVFSGSGTENLTEIGVYYRDKLLNWPDGGCNTVAVPAKIEAENYCDMSGIQTETCEDTGGGLNVGYIETGDWMSYTINVPTAGTYTVSYRVASQNGAGQLQLEQKGGGVVYGTIDIDQTYEWQNWTTVSHKVQLPAGVQDIAIAAKAGGWNINRFEITGGSQPSKYLEAEDYSYMSGIQTETCEDAGGGLNVGYLDAGDWLSYHGVNIPAGTYLVEYRVASQNGGGQLQLEKAGGEVVYSNINVPSTGWWQTWTTITHQVDITEYTENFGISVPEGGYNINWIKFTPVRTKAADEFIGNNERSDQQQLVVYPNPVSDIVNLEFSKDVTGSFLKIYNVSGQLISNTIISSAEMDLDVSGFEPGVYIVQVNEAVKRIMKH